MSGFEETSGGFGGAWKLGIVNGLEAGSGLAATGGLLSALNPSMAKAGGVNEKGVI